MTNQQDIIDSIGKRKIKFRAWNKKLQTMVYEDEDNSSDYWDGAVASYVQMVNTQFCNWTTEKYVWMQFTGLHDKNGKEIYEGDIVHYKEIIPSTNAKQREIQGADYTVLDFIGQVVWDSEGASFDIQGEGENYRGFGARGKVSYEIIGNVFENSSLLDKPETKAAGDRSIEAAKREEFARIKAEAEAFCGYGYSAKYAITEEMHNFFSALESGESFLSPKNDE